MILFCSLQQHQQNQHQQIVTDENNDYSLKLDENSDEHFEPDKHYDIQEDLDLDTVSIYTVHCHYWDLGIYRRYKSYIN